LTYDKVHQRVREWLGEDGVCDTCRILDILVEKNLTLSFWGDSMQQQVFDGFLCEISRRNYTIVNKEVRRMPEPTGLFKLQSITTVTVASPNWQQQENQHATIKFFFQYRPKDKVKEVYNESITHLLEGGTDILFFNFGLHWDLSRRGAYQKLMLITMTALKQHAVGKISLLAFRETSAQHFDTSIGEWPTNKGPFNCTPLDATKRLDPLFGWRSRDILDAASKSGLTLVNVDPSGKSPMPPLQHSDKDDEVALLPFTEFTSELHDLHPGECTHYCSTPHLWNPLWRSLRLAMDRRFGFNNKI
jgi:hypothetical protein